MLIHIVGDIHQPLHSAGLKNKRFPNGDKGGNLFNIRYKSINAEYKNLHKFFDGIADFIPSIKRVIIILTI